MDNKLDTVCRNFHATAIGGIMQTVTICNDCPLFHWRSCDCNYYHLKYINYEKYGRYESKDCGLVEIVFKDETYTPKREEVHGNTEGV